MSGGQGLRRGRGSYCLMEMVLQLEQMVERADDSTTLGCA